MSTKGSLHGHRRDDDHQLSRAFVTFRQLINTTASRRPVVVDRMLKGLSAKYRLLNKQTVRDVLDLVKALEDIEECLPVFRERLKLFLEEQILNESK